MRMMFDKFSFREEARILLVFLPLHDITSTIAFIFHLNYQLVPREAFPNHLSPVRSHSPFYIIYLFSKLLWTFILTPTTACKYIS